MGLLFELETMATSMVAFKTLLRCWMSGKVDEISVLGDKSYGRQVENRVLQQGELE